MSMKPSVKPSNPNFSSGPCAKRPGWKPDALADALIGRSHRAAIAKKRIQSVIDRSKSLLGLPEDYVLGIVPASDTGAIEMALWSLLGARGVDVLAWESFGATWVSDIVNELKLADVRSYLAEYGQLPDLDSVDFERDVVFTFNGTTSGVRLKDLDWIPSNRQGLTLCDATSAVFAMEMDYSKLDVITWSWQKVMGGEAAHGMIALSPRALERLETYTPPWPMPKIFKLAKKNKVISGIFSGATINTVSMLCVEDAIDGLNWADSLGGLNALINRSKSNLAAIEDWVERTDWIDFLADDVATRSSTSICLKIVAPWYLELTPENQAAKAKALVSVLEKEGIAYDINSYRDAPPGIRIWGGATVETQDIKALLPWLEWAFEGLEQN
ncbi:MAG: phosphoserine transaminase [Puniceicoccaceae bacterium]|nr:MAG: phosphoserine transaminase [Puniceicoccaceae bacterium]